MSHNEDSAQVWVRVKKKDNNDIYVEIITETTLCATGHCGAVAGGCQSNVFVGLFAPAPLLILRQVSINIKEGDSLLLSLPHSAVIQLAFWGYGLPLVVLLIGLWLGQTLFGDVGALFIGLSGALLTWLLMGKLKPSVVPSILEIKSITV
jgi:positive regulator of sigma E activity